MGRRYKNLYEQVCSFENLWLASRKARRGKRSNPAVLDFEYHLEENLFNIREQLMAQAYRFSPYNYFHIYEPKERLIASAPYKDRVVHHALCNIIEPVLDKAMIFDSYACRINKGSHRAIERAQTFLNKNKWVLKLDIKKYFFTIDHRLLLSDLSKKISDVRLLRFIENILDTFTSSADYYFDFGGAAEGKRSIGLPIGNLTSQLFANYFLTPLDRFVKEELKMRHYLRYMDDALIFGDTKHVLFDVKNEIEAFLSARFLKLHPKKCQVFPAKQGVPFLGFHLYPGYRKILRPNLQRFKKRMKYKSLLYEQNELEWQKLLLSLNGWLGFASGLNNDKFLTNVLQTIRLRHQHKDIIFTFCIN